MQDSDDLKKIFPSFSELLTELETTDNRIKLAT
jgi:hypothetical protein